jgi:uncharacterized membrane protein YozB (DUF420 family)
MSGIFPDNAPLFANVTLLVEIAMGIALVLGAWLARRRRYRLHAYCQSFVVFLNLVVISVAMIPSLNRQVLPKIPARLGWPFYTLATVHAVTASAAQAAAFYVLLAAGTVWLPSRWRLKNFKTAMRTVLVLWWMALLLGVATYVRWYVPLAAAR